MCNELDVNKICETCYLIALDWYEKQLEKDEDLPLN